MSARVRVLVADDSPTARHMLVTVCRADPALEVVGEAGDGEEAVALTLRLHPDIVVMDVHMPRLDGLAATRRIMEQQPTPVLVVTATVRPDDVALAMRGVEAGAVAVTQKPAGPDDGNVSHGAVAFRRKVRNLAGVRVIRRYERPPPRASARPRHLRWQGRAVGIAASTGGPVALRDLLRPLPADFPAPVAVVQHIAEGFLPGFARWLAADLALEVHIASHGAAFVPGRVHLAPDEHHLAISREGRLALEDGAALNGFRPSASVLFSSLAAFYGSAAVGVILTGLGSDGLDGLRGLREAGGCVLAEDPATAVAPGMPDSVVRAELADIVAPVADLTGQLVQVCTRERATP